MKVVKKILIYLGIAFLVLMISLDSFVITYGDFSFTFLIRIFVWAALIVILLYLDGGWFAKKNEDEVKYSKTKSNVILIVSSVVIILIFGLLALQ